MDLSLTILMIQQSRMNDEIVASDMMDVLTLAIWMCYVESTSDLLGQE